MICIFFRNIFYCVWKDKAITEEKGTEEPHAEEKGNDYARQIVERKTFNKHRLASLNEVFVSEDASRSSQLLHKEYNLSEILNRPFRDSETVSILFAISVFFFLSPLLN